MQTCVNVKRADSVAETARRILKTQLRLMEVNGERAARVQSVSAIRTLRLSVRRFRAALWAFGDLMPGPLVKRLRRKLLILNRRLGPIRDAQLWLALVRRTMRKRKAGFPVGVALCAKAAEVSCEIQLQELGRIVKSMPLQEAQECCNQLSGEQPAGPFLAAKLFRAYKPLCRIKNPLVGVTIEEEHAFRRHCRRVKYLSEFAAPLMGRPVQKLSRSLKRASSTLGDRHDAEVQARLLADMAEPPNVLLLKVACAKHEAQQEFVEAWGRLTRPHFEKRVLSVLRAAKRAEK